VTDRRQLLLLACVATWAGCARPFAAPGGRETVRPASSTLELARFMRETVNVPFSFAVLEYEGPQRHRRIERAAVVLKDAVRDLVHWQAPPVVSAEARDVFFEYARQLERQVADFEVAARAHDLDATASRLEAVRQSCNSCHRLFRPASVVSVDVVYGRLAIGLGGRL